jgi:PAS domain S-box-containing protein
MKNNNLIKTNKNLNQTVQTKAPDLQNKYSELNKSEEICFTLVENTNDGIVIYQNGIIKFVNKALYCLLGYEAEECIGKTIESCVVAEDQKYIMQMQRDKEAGKNVPNALTISLIKKDNSTLPTEINVVEINYESEPAAMLLIRDISERKQMEDQREKALEEKILLLEEIHHRVKNNLQVICSLLHLQAIHIKDKESIKAFNDSIGRIRSIAKVHEQIYNSENFSDIDFQKYVESIINDLHISNEINGRIKHNISVKNINLGLDDAIPIGILLNELLTNSYKHAFPCYRKGKIDISFEKVNKHSYQLIYNDDGIGIPEEINFENTEKLGLTLIKILTEQIEGNVKLERINGTKFIIKFKGYNYGNIKYSNR